MPLSQTLSETPDICSTGASPYPGTCLLPTPTAAQASRHWQLRTSPRRFPPTDVRHFELQLPTGISCVSTTACLVFDTSPVTVASPHPPPVFNTTLVFSQHCTMRQASDVKQASHVVRRERAHTHTHTHTHTVAWLPTISATSPVDSVGLAQTPARRFAVRRTDRTAHP